VHLLVIGQKTKIGLQMGFVLAGARTRATLADRLIAFFILPGSIRPFYCMVVARIL